jgi:hypothetical protein
VYGIKDILAANAAGAVLAIIDDIVLDVCIAVQVDSVHCAARRVRRPRCPGATRRNTFGRWTASRPTAAGTSIVNISFFVTERFRSSMVQLHQCINHRPLFCAKDMDPE